MKVTNENEPISSTIDCAPNNLKSNIKNSLTNIQSFNTILNNNSSENNDSNSNTDPKSVHLDSSRVSKSWNPLTRALFVRAQGYDTDNCDNDSTRKLVISPSLISTPIASKNIIAATTSTYTATTNTVPRTSLSSSQPHTSTFDTVRENEEPSPSESLMLPTKTLNLTLQKSFDAPLRMLPVPDLRKTNTKTTPTTHSSIKTIERSDKTVRNRISISPVENVKEDSFLFKNTESSSTASFSRKFNAGCAQDFIQKTPTKAYSAKIVEPSILLNSAKTLSSSHNNISSSSSIIESPNESMKSKTDITIISPLSESTHRNKRFKTTMLLDKNYNALNFTNNNNNGSNKEYNMDSNFVTSSIKSCLECQQSNERKIKEISDDVDTIMTKLDSFTYKYDECKQEYVSLKNTIDEYLHENHLKFDYLLSLYQQQKCEILDSNRLYKSIYKQLISQDSIHRQMVENNSIYAQKMHENINYISDLVDSLKKTCFEKNEIFIKQCDDDLDALKIQVRHILNDIRSIQRHSRNVLAAIHYDLYNSSHKLKDHISNISTGFEELEQIANELQIVNKQKRTDELQQGKCKFIKPLLLLVFENEIHMTGLVIRQPEKKVYGTRSAKNTNNSNAEESTVKKRKKRLSTKKDFETIGVESSDDAERQMQDMIATISKPITQKEDTTTNNKTN